MTRRDLNRISELITKIRALRANVADLEMTIKSPCLEDTGSSPTRNTKSTVEQRAIRLASVREKLKKAERELEWLEGKLELYMDSMSDEWLESIIRYRFVSGYGWRETADKMNTSEGSIKMYYKRKIPFE